MAIIEIKYEWYNRRNPKCRNCVFWGGDENNYYNDCSNQDFNGQKIRAHNSKACIRFKLKHG